MSKLLHVQPDPLFSFHFPSVEERTMWVLRRKYLKKFVLLICISIIGCFLLSLTDIRASKLWSSSSDIDKSITESLMERRDDHYQSTCIRQLQLWTSRPLYLYSKVPERISCPSIPCEAYVVADASLATLQTSDAVLLFPKTAWSWEEMHRVRPRGQKWIFYSRESPARTRKSIVPPPEYHNNSYDYIMTFRRGFDFSATYGTYDPSKPEVPADDERNWAENKTGLVIWVASNCRDTAWKRQAFVNELKTLIPVNTYGKCGTNGSCIAGEHCETKLKQHKFYLALENSRCRDYITEKFFLNLQRGTVPIVYGPPREDYERVAPPTSFIHIDDFPDVRALADYITRLDKDDRLYNKFFDWKKMGSVVDIRNRYNLFKQDVMCQIFERMHSDELKERAGISTKRKMPDWQQWWLGSCSELLRE